MLQQFKSSTTAPIKWKREEPIAIGREMQLWYKHTFGRQNVFNAIFIIICLNYSACNIQLLLCVFTIHTTFGLYSPAQFAFPFLDFTAKKRWAMNDHRRFISFWCTRLRCIVSRHCIHYAEGGTKCEWKQVDGKLFDIHMLAWYLIFSYTNCGSLCFWRDYRLILHIVRLYICTYMRNIFDSYQRRRQQMVFATLAVPTLSLCFYFSFFAVFLTQICRVRTRM